MNDQTLLEVLLGEFHRKLQHTTFIVRDAVFPIAENKIKVAVGMRRAGKTSFIYQTIQALLVKKIPLSRILYINFEDDRLVPLTREKLAKLVDAFYALYPENHDQRCYLFLDEIQNAEDWPMVIRRLQDSKNVEIYLTGSSAKLLSKEIATSLRGRSLATEIWPFSFQEFLRAKKITALEKLFDQKKQDQLKKIFHEYLFCGGFPEVVNYPVETRIKTLQEYIDVVSYRDIIERHQIKNIALLKYTIFFMLQNYGSSFSINKFYNDLKTQGYQTSKNVLYDYAHHIEDAFLAFCVGLFDRSIRKTQTNPKKIYTIDPGLSCALKINNQYDLGRLFENVVYLDLRRQGCQVYYYLTKDRYEVDFVAQSFQGKQKLIQVCWDAADPETMKREERALVAAQKELKMDGELVTLESYLRNGVIV
ncbi:MAG TPA: ATP-binding protein [Coxiellaceae bacterium]|nr:MAG: ATPase [Gammaproteobacteria bacterium RIFCSPHIGHO2_12_FULL_36_30]HLB55841.1 ATP-binding protein [Coxiellaceae bacterium]